MEKDMKERLFEVLKNLTEEQKERMKACKSPSEIIARLSEMGVELPDELLDAVAGGADTPGGGVDLVSLIMSSFWQKTDSTDSVYQQKNFF